MKKFIKFLVNLSKRIESAEFIDHNGRGEKVKELREYLESKRKTRRYNLNFLGNEYVEVTMSSNLIFKSVYGIDVKSSNRYLTETRDNNTAICILSSEDTREEHQLETIVLKVYNYVKNLKKVYGICDNETEAYLFGFLVSEITMDFLGVCGLQKALSGFSGENVIDRRLIRFPRFKYSIVSFGDRDWDEGNVVTYLGTYKAKMTIIRKKKRTVKNDISTWAHELYHLTRNTSAIIGRDIYYWPEQLLEEYFWKSLPVLKLMLKGKI